MNNGPVLGISLYLSEAEDDNLARLAQCPARGITQAFTSLHIPEDTNVSEQPTLLRRLGVAADQVGVRIYADLSPLTLARWDLPGRNAIDQVAALTEWGVGGVRFDDGFSMQSVAAVSRRMPIQLNASTATAADTSALLAGGAVADNIEVLHNFYPRVDTGLPRVAFGTANARFRSLGFRVGAFVAGDGIARGPLRVGLPTLEEHRDIDPIIAAVDLWQGLAPGYGVDTIYVGDIDLSDQTWTRWPFLAQGTTPIRWTVSATDAEESLAARQLTDRVLSNRVDASDRVIRIREARPLIGQPADAAMGPILTGNSGSAGLARPRGSVTVDNDRYGRYAGESQLTRIDLPADPRVTVLGQVLPLDLPLIDLLPGGAHLILLAESMTTGP